MVYFESIELLKRPERNKQVD